MEGVRVVKPPEPKTKKYIIEMLRGLMETAYKEKILYIDISIKTTEDKKLRSFSFGDTNHYMD